jgi:hypothetical protein
MYKRLRKEFKQDEETTSGFIRVAYQPNFSVITLQIFLG